MNISEPKSYFLIKSHAYANFYLLAAGAVGVVVFLIALFVGTWRTSQLELVAISAIFGMILSFALHAAYRNYYLLQVFKANKPYVVISSEGIAVNTGKEELFFSKESLKEVIVYTYLSSGSRTNHANITDKKGKKVNILLDPIGLSKTNFLNTMKTYTGFSGDDQGIRYF